MLGALLEPASRMLRELRIPAQTFVADGKFAAIWIIAAKPEDDQGDWNSFVPIGKTAAGD